MHGNGSAPGASEGSCWDESQNLASIFTEDDIAQMTEGLENTPRIRFSQRKDTLKHLLVDVQGQFSERKGRDKCGLVNILCELIVNSILEYFS